MGCPSKYYKKALQNFASILIKEDKKLSEQLLNETSDAKLEKFIMNRKNEVTPKQFYYNAGRTSEYILTDSQNDGNDAFNACIGGLIDFENFIEIKHDE